MDNSEIRSILKTLGARVPTSSRLILVGGGALALLGNSRQTIDIDFIGDDIHPSVLDTIIMQVARELKIYIEPVALHSFIPLPEGSDERNILIGQFGNLEVYAADPYSIAISKLDRGFDTDLDDIVFLIQNDLIKFEELERFTNEILPRTGQFDIDPNQLLAHLQVVYSRLV